MKTNGYHHALLVVNLLPEGQSGIITQALELKEAWPQIKFSLINVITKIPTHYFQVPSIIDVQGKLFEEAHGKLVRLAMQLSIAQDDQHLVEGTSLEKEVLRKAEELDVDLIITGDSDGDFIPSIFGGSVINRLIHHAHRNVLCLHQENVQTHH